MPKILITIAMFIALTSTACASPCDGVSRTLTSENKATLEKAIAEQLQIKNVEVFQTFKLDDWSIVYVNTHQSDEAFLFYSGDPLSHHYITLWGGAAAPDEEQEIKNWAVQNASGIPVKLASCFAWHVTKDRDM